MSKTFAQINREIDEKREFQEGLRKQIDRMPDGYERETKIDLLFVLHREIRELDDLLYR